ncbi:urea ABC transporter permease subunit UrtB [Beggiatoa leptomitoformis]|uniref:Urea ABC transporter permease subunit UrtB n=1 Tax=Beggiatoa leptomitoformis TaxID=288004 RepID=A0A2N9YB29_9GAMM|nr:urea ABC transporter permease subunit UrtB [Beggiatoa leptomitoformis]ALG66953.1 urea ABC transporter permease subunit UrtB [Beggiatoa leptomitoformis]AUI67678.1 urea ABC transporter permease subunit UrtB [Beggiatoa leptomitoformis]
MTRYLIGFIWLLCLIQPLQAETFETAVSTLSQATDRSTLITAIQQFATVGDERGLKILEALRDEQLRITDNQRVLIITGQQAKDVSTGETIDTTGLTFKELPSINNALRRALLPAIGQLQLNVKDPVIRLQAAEELRKRPPEGAEAFLKTAIAREQDPKINQTLKIALAQIELSSTDRQTRLNALHLMQDVQSSEFTALLTPLLAKNPDGSFVETDEEIRATASTMLNALEAQQQRIAQWGNLFYGLSLGSILLLAALGLAITFGLMGVINMAHGEMLMLGAYSTYVVQNLFRDYLPASLFDWYLLLALPVAFLVSASVGVVLERSIIRFLYNRPLETLLATWGIGLILIQTVRLLFGAQNVQVANPSWLSGGIEVANNLVLPYNRLAIIGFVIFVVFLVWFILRHTPLGLKVRAVTQNRQMAACMGIRTAHVDMWTFGLGSGVAGLGGVALSQIGNVGPELGQSYIIDSFMVVVLGGVGNIAGAVFGALGLGMLSKFLEPEVGAVMAKILMLVFIILFIQKRPQGLFALKGRFVEN